MKLKIRHVSCLFVALSSPAFADMTANYVDDSSGMTIKIEVASNNDMRFSGTIQEISGDLKSYIVVHEGRGYQVRTLANGPIVLRCDDLATIMADYLKDHKADIPGLPTEKTTILNLEEGGSLLVRGRLGNAYYLDFSSPSLAGKPIKPLLVISNDIELRPLSAGVAAFYSISMAIAGHWVDYESKNQKDILASGMPLKVANLELATVTRDPIPVARFTPR